MNNLQAMPPVLEQDADAWALRINARWRQSVENIIEAGQLLIDAKAQLQHGEFENLLRTKLDFNPSVGQRLMSIARDTRLTNPAHAQLLPRSWTTLYELTKLSDDEFDRGLAENIISPDMERADVELIRPTPQRGVPESTQSDAGAHLREGNDAANGTAPQPSELEPQSHGEDRPARPDPLPLSMPSGGLAIAHRRDGAEDDREFFPTPLWGTRALFEHVLVHLERRAHCKYQSVLEPACGEGHMAEVLKEYFPMVIGADKFDYGKGYGVADFLDADTFTNSDWIITNPPFRKSTDFVLKAIELAGTGVAMFVRAAWLEGVDRYERIFRDHPPTLISFFTERVPLHKGRWEPEGNTFTAYIWLVWIKGAEPQPPFWIPPGCREALTMPDDAKRFGTCAADPAAAQTPGIEDGERAA